jgi:hypothetical protein
LVAAINAAVEAGDLSGVVASADGDNLVLTSTVASLNVSGAYGETEGVATDKVAGSQSSVTVGGDVTVTAEGIEASATFYYVSAYAYGEGVVASIDITGGITVQATGVESAFAKPDYLGAYAYDVDTTASVTIDGDVTATATAMGDASVSGGTVSFDLAAGIAVDDVLTFTVGDGAEQTFTVTTEASLEELVAAINAAVEAEDSGVIASADGDNLVLTSTVTSLNVSGVYDGAEGVVVYAEAFEATATARLDFISAYANQSADNGDALLDINGSVIVQATAGQEAIAFSGGGAYAYGEDSTATVHIAGDYEVTAVVEAVYATGDSTELLGSSHYASASLYDISAYIAGWSANIGVGAVAAFEIDGNVTVSATSPGDAYAGLYYLYAEADAVSSEASVTIGGDVLVEAVAGTGNAYAYMTTVYADAYGENAIATVSIGGGITVEATSEEGYARAEGPALYAWADGDGAIATVTVDGDYSVMASGNSAYASFYTSISASADGVGATASVDIVGNIITQATGVEYAYALNGYYLAVQASDVDTTATVTVGGDVVATATAMGDASAETFYATATAYVSWLSAYANSNAEDGDALLDIHGSVIVQATAGEAAYAYSGGGAYAYGEDSTATVHIAGDYEVTAVVEAVYATDATVESAPLGSGHYASASLYDISAYISGWSANIGVGAVAAFEIDGNVTVSATSPGYAEAELWYVYASANALSAEASVTIGGDVLVEAAAGTGTAYAYMTTVYADAGDAGAAATVSIGGGVTVQASSDEGYAGAYAYGLAAWSYGGAIAGAVSFDLAEVVIAADDELTLTVEGGEAQTFTVPSEISVDGVITLDALVAAINAAVEAGDLSGVVASADGNSLVLTSTVTSLNVSGAYGEAEGVTTDKVAGSQSSVTVGDDVTVMATGNSANATFSYASVTADAGGAVASIDIAGGITVQAAGVENAYGYVGYLGANAYEADTIARVTIDGDVAATATAMGDASVSGGTVSFDLADVVIAADDELTFTVSGGAAQTFIVTDETTVAELVAAINAAVEAEELSGVVASADGDSLVLTSTVTSLNVSGAYGEDAGAQVFAETFYATATAYVTYLSAWAGTNAQDGDALLDINGSVIVQATAGERAYAYSGGGAYARGEDSTATIHIAGDYEVTAVVEAVYAPGDSTELLGSSHYASASLYDISAYIRGTGYSWNGTYSTYQTYEIGEGAVAAFEIDGNVTVSATSPDDAYAGLWNVYAEARAISSEASVSIGGDVLVAAIGGIGAATASLSTVYAEAWGNDSLATVTITGNVTARAEADTYAEVYAYGFGASATDNANASVTVAGEILVEAYQDQTGAVGSIVPDAYARLDSMYATVVNVVDSTTAESATLDVGNVTVIAQSELGAADAGIGEILSDGDGASVLMGAVNVSAAAATSANAELMMLAGNAGDIEIDGVSISAVASAEEGNAFAQLGVMALGEGTADLGAVSVDVRAGTAGTGEAGIALGVAGDVDMESVFGASGSGSIVLDSLSVSLQNANANVWIGDVTRDDSLAATFTGIGNVDMVMAEAAFGTIDRSDLDGALELLMAMENQDVTGSDFDAFDYTVLKGFDATTDELNFGSASIDVTRSEGYVYSPYSDTQVDYAFTKNLLPEITAESQVSYLNTSSASESDAITRLLAELDDSAIDVAYVQFTGSATLAGGQVIDGAAEDWFAVAYDGDDTGITSLMLVQSVNGTFGLTNLLYETGPT